MTAVSTMIAGVHGMNFEHVPEPRHPLDCPAAMAPMAAVSLGLYRFLRRRDRP